MEKLSKEAQEDLACAVIELGAKNKRLRQQNEELLEALKTLHIWSIRSTGHFGCDPFFDCGGDENCTCGKTHALNGAADAIAKATEGEK